MRNLLLSLIVFWCPLVTFSQDTLSGSIQTFVLTFAQDPARKLATQIDEYVLPLVATNNFSGNIIVSRNGNILFKNSYGYESVEDQIKISEKTIFQVASVSKFITATAIMRLVENGSLELTQPLSDFIPDYPRGQEITIHHLLTHTSGIANINDLNVYDSLEQLQHTPLDLIHWFKDEDLRFNPGEKYAYSNSNYTLLAYIIEKVSGRNYGDYLKNEFFIPLKMMHSGHPAAGNAPFENKATGYEPEGIGESKPSRTLNWTVKTGNGSLYSSIDDLYTWATKYFNGEILNDSSLSQMLTNHAGNMGYGLFIRPRNGRNQYHINGRSPGFTSVLSFYPDSALLIIILSNNYVPVPTQMSIDFASMVFNEPYQPIISGDGKVPPEKAEKFRGQYQFGPDFYQPNAMLTVQEFEGYLTIDWGGLYYTGGNSFIHRDYWTEVKFGGMEDGRKRMIYDRFEGVAK